MTADLVALRPQTLDVLWAEAETLGSLRVWTNTDLSGRRITGYRVYLTGHRKNTKLEIERSHTVLVCALADAINEAREMGLGEPE